MNAYQRYTQRLAGAPVDRPPNFNIFMTCGTPHANLHAQSRVLREWAR
jgi:hypothetical protein